MKIPDELIPLIKIYILPAVALILSSLLGFLWWFIKRTWKEYEDKISKHSSSINELMKSISDREKSTNEIVYSIRSDLAKESSRLTNAMIENREKAREEHKELADFAQQLRTELAVYIRNAEYTTKSINSLEGILIETRKDLKTVEKVVDKLDGKVDALFRAVDAPKRATDK